MKQVIIVREDLNMPHGKLAAQVAHGSVTNILNTTAEDVYEWFNNSQPKVVLGVGSLTGLMKYAALASQAGLCVNVITDEGRTVFNEPTATCCAIGPAPIEAIDAITGRLRLYRARE